MKNKVYIGDNLAFLKENQDKFDCVYMDPPYNTGNTFRYKDKMDADAWETMLEDRIVEAKRTSYTHTPFIISIAEKSLFSVLKVLNKNFKFVFPPFVWQTKNVDNFNKSTNISNICHEYVIVACDENIKTNYEIVEASAQKLSNYPLSIVLTKDLTAYSFEVVDGKKIYKIDDYKIKKSPSEESYKGHYYQKRTAQLGHGSMRYIDLMKKISDYDSNTLYFLDGVNDKSGLNGKFLLGNAYFQSIEKQIKTKIPSLLGFYQAGVKDFQTAKPKDLIKRILSAFSKPGDLIFDMYGGSGNVCVAINEIGRYFYTCEIGAESEVGAKKGDFILKNLLHIEKEVIK